MTEHAAARDRSGTPWPLILHLASAASLLEQGARLAPLASSTTFPWNGPLDENAAVTAQAIAASDPARMAIAIRSEAAKRLLEMNKGLRRYQVSEHQRTLPDPPTIWHAGASRLLDYGPASGRPVLVAPSLINRPHILDLDQDASLLRYLSEQGFRPLLLDWGDPDREERSFMLNDYVEQRLLPALDFARSLTNTPIPLVGYCLGGVLAIAATVLRSADVEKLALIGAPWDFRGMAPMRSALASLGVAADRQNLAALVDMLAATYGAIPMPVIQSVFAQLDPGLALRKFRRLAAMPEASPEARRFVLLEDWLNEGPPLSAPAARQAIVEWHLGNAPMRGEWRIGGNTICPTRISSPALVVAAEKDRIAPREAVAPVAELIPHARLLQPSSGHVGMIAGRDAMNQLWRPLAQFLKK